MVIARLYIKQQYVDNFAFNTIDDFIEFAESKDLRSVIYRNNMYSGISNKTGFEHLFLLTEV